MLKLFFVLPSILLLAFLPQEPATAPEKSALPADAATMTNPVTPNAESKARAKTIYGMDCAICHGEKGNGKGELVADMQLKMKDFTKPDTLQGVPDGELFYAIKNGDDKVKMPAEGPRAKDAEIWNLIILMRSFSR
jgi:mono/diheme cytochrome c family protein